VPELPEVEVLVRHLRPLLQNRIIRAVQVRRLRLIAPTSARQFAHALRGAQFVGLSRRGKYLLFTLRLPGRREPRVLVGHLGMTGRMYLAGAKVPLPKHAAVVLDLGRENFVFEDTRYFGRLTFDKKSVEKLGPEPLSADFTPESFADALSHSKQPIKVKLLDQSVIAGVGNIYASEALFRAGLSPRLRARRLNKHQVERLWRAVREVLAEAIEGGSTVPLNYAGAGARDRLFYFGRAPETPEFYEERLRVYDRAGRRCPNCQTIIKRLVQAARSTFYCPRCQRS
jgi:formamidopyrimidine-DNA glycosylase